MNLTISELSKRGGRAKNEDRTAYTQTESSALMVLADGMGGHPDGEVAAEIAIRTTIELFHREVKSSILLDPTSFLMAALRVAHHRIIRYGTEHGLNDVPRTTAVVSVVQQGKVWWAHCGDSRLYLVRHGKIKACTVDHSHAKNFDKTGVAAQAAANRNVLYTCLGSISLPVIEVAGPTQLAPEDRIMLCSDGLWGPMPDKMIGDILGLKQDLSQCVSMLVDMALSKAGKLSDNVSVVAGEWEPILSQARASLHKEETQDTSIYALFSGNSNLTSEIDDSIDEINEVLKRIQKLP